jgi:hypothetical protein
MKQQGSISRNGTFWLLRYLDNFVIDGRLVRKLKVVKLRCPPRLGTKTPARDSNKCCLNVSRITTQVRCDRIASYAMHGAGATVLVNVMRIPCFGRRMTIGRASIIWPGAN